MQAHLHKKPRFVKLVGRIIRLLWRLASIWAQELREVVHGWDSANGHEYGRRYATPSCFRKFETQGADDALMVRA